MFANEAMISSSCSDVGYLNVKVCLKEEPRLKQNVAYFIVDGGRHQLNRFFIITNANFALNSIRTRTEYSLEDLETLLLSDLLPHVQVYSMTSFYRTFNKTKPKFTHCDLCGL